MSDRTTIIVSNLTRDDFLANGKALSLANNLKIGVLNIPGQTNFSRQVNQWSELPFLCRIVAIFHSPAAAQLAYDYLEASYGGNPLFTLPGTVKISLQENLLQRSRLVGALSDECDLVENTGYQEPKPQAFDAQEDLKRLGIDVSALNETTPSPVALGRSRSVTKTLFRPELALDTRVKGSPAPSSPSITLEETF